MKIIHINDGNVFCDKYNCDCNIKFEVTDKKFPTRPSYICPRIKDGVKRDDHVLYAEFFSHLARDWDIRNSVVQARHGDPNLREALSRIATSVGPNQIPIPAPMNGTFPVSSSWEPNLSAFEQYKLWDMKYMQFYLGFKRNRTWFEENVWKEVGSYHGTKWETDRPRSLEIEAARTASYFNRAFAGYVVPVEGQKTRFWHSYYSQENFYPTKIPKLMAKYNKSTNILPPLMAQHKPLLAMGIHRLMKVAGWQTHFKSYKWSYEKAISDFVSISSTSSFGLRPGPIGKVEEVSPGVFKKVTVLGKKLEQFQYSAREIDEAVKNFHATGKFSLPAEYAKITPKSEIHHVEALTREAGEKARDKAREYFITDLITISLAQLVHGYRQRIERGNIIRIGMDWHKGGMYEFAKYFRYDDPDMRYITFDITGYDTSVLRVLLETYSRWSLQYMDFETPEDKALYMAMLKEATKRLSTKICNMFGDVWRIIDGVMPSGAYETSHGDSWITALVFMCMIVYFSIKDIRFRKLLENKSIAERLMLSVYGDDNVLGFPKELLPWFTEENVAFFFKEFANFEVRDFVVHSEFRSYTDPLGEIKKKGVVFLQKYCVDTPLKFQGPGIAPVVHYRPASVSIKKFAKGSGDTYTNFDYFLSSITGPYDNPFNQVAYDFYKHMYYAYLPKDDSWRDSIREVMENKGGYVNRQFRKGHMNIEDLKFGFPSMNKLRQLSLHDPDHHRNKFSDIWTKDIIYD